MSGSQRQTTLGTLRTLDVISTSELVFLNLLPDVSTIPVSVHGVFDVIRRLSEAVMKGELTEDEFALRDRNAVLLKLSEDRYFASWVPRTFELQGTHLEYTSNKKDTKRHGINLTPECFCLDSDLKDAKSKHVITLVTRHKVLHVACPTFGEKLSWVSSLARAILVPRKRTIGLSQTSLFKGALGEVKSLDDFPGETHKALSQGGVVDLEQVKWAPTARKKPVKKFVVLQQHLLRLYRDRASFETGARPVGYIVLDHSSRVVKRTEVALEIRMESEPTSPATLLEFASSKRREEFTLSLEASINALKSRLSSYLAYYSTKSFTDAPSKQERTESSREKQADPVSVDPPVDTTKLTAPKPAAPVEAPPPPQAAIVVEPMEEERDGRPLIVLRARWLETSGVLGGEETPLASVHLDVDLSLAVARDEIFTQLPLESIPARFSFLRAPDALRSQLLPLAGVAVVTSDLEGEILVKDCLLGVNALLLSCTKDLVQETDNWEEERRAYKQIIMHLEAQLAEARRLLSDKARLLKRSGEQDLELRSHLFQALSALQRDGFLEGSVDLEALEHSYLCVFAEEDALRAFAFSPNCPLRPIWRKLCADPKRVRQYIEDLETHVLRPFRIRKERLSSPFWSLKVLRDARFLADSSAFAAWAKEEPWCEDDAERHVYLTSKLFYKSSTDEEFRILLKPIPSEPPATKDARSVEAVKDAFAKQRPASFMSTPESLEAMRRFQERKSKSSTNVGPVPPSKPLASEANATPESDSRTRTEALPSASSSGEVEKVAPAASVDTGAKEILGEASKALPLGGASKVSSKVSAEEDRATKTLPPVPVRKAHPTGVTSSPPAPVRSDEPPKGLVDPDGDRSLTQATTSLRDISTSPQSATVNTGDDKTLTEPKASSPSPSVPPQSADKPVKTPEQAPPALPPNKPVDGSFKARPVLPPGKPRRASELDIMSEDDLRALLGRDASAEATGRAELLEAARALLKQDEELL